MTDHNGTKSGQSLVEFALVLPFSLVTIMAIVVFGMALARLEAVENAASEGARAAQRWVPGGPETCVQAVHNAIDRATPFATTIVVNGSCPTDTISRVNTGSLITIEVSHSYQPIFFATLFRSIWEPPATMPLEAEVTVMHE
ncbi:MAG: TadE/TadG family type IV pilus assembly protein [Anaerolineales bacterium]